MKIKPKIYYLAMTLETGHILDIVGWAPGMVGVMAIFDTKEAAEEHARGKCKTVRLIAEEEK